LSLRAAVEEKRLKCRLNTGKGRYGCCSLGGGREASVAELVMRSRDECSNVV